MAISSAFNRKTSKKPSGRNYTRPLSATYGRGYSYDTIPAQLFIRLLQRDEAVAERVVGSGAWKKIKEQWLEAREDDKGGQLLEARRKVLLESCKYNKANLLIQWVRRADDARAREVFDEIRIPWSDDKGEREKRLAKMLNKHGELVKKAQRQLAELETPEESDEAPRGFNQKDFDENLASLEAMGFTIENYLTLPLAKYEAMNRVALKKIKAREEAGNTHAGG